MISLLLALFVTSATLDSTNYLYGRNDVDGLREICRDVTERVDRLLCAYRLYPLTNDESLLASLPTSLENGTARELALLSGLWGYRTASASFPLVIRYGRIAESAMRDARSINPFDPFVLLIEGQSLMFKPRIAGGDRREALRRFERLASVLKNDPHPDLELIEADVWIWYARHRLDDAGSGEMREQLLAAGPPSLYRDFLLSPP